MIILVLITAGMSNPVSISEVNAQERVGKTIERKKKRRIRKRTRRRVRRRVSRRAHFAYRGLPRYRSVVRVVPSGAIVVRRSGVAYHYYEGIFYRPVNDSFTIIRPTPGIRVITLPSAARRIMVRNTPYFYYYGTFYTENNGEYEVISAPEGAVVDALPEDYEVIEKDNMEYYVLEGVYYQEIEVDNGEIGYEVVSI